MNLEQRCNIPVARPKLWALLMDVPKVASCIPGVDAVTATSDDQYTGQMRVKVGPISLTFQGVITVQEQDQQNWRGTLRAEANDRRVGGGLHATTHMTLTELSPNETELHIQTEARLLGKLGEFGQPLIKKKADEMLTLFARNVANKLEDAAT